MGEIIIFIIIAAVISSIRKASAKGQKERAEQRAQGVPPFQKSAYERPSEDPRFPPFTPQSQQHMPQASHPMAMEAQAAAERRRHAARAEGLRKKREAMQSRSSGSPKGPGSSGAPMAALVKVDNLVEMKMSHLTATKGRKDTLEGRGTHAHVEGGISGGQPDCGSVAPIKELVTSAAQNPQSVRGPIFQRVLQYEDPLVQGMLMAEILGKPKSLRVGNSR